MNIEVRTTYSYNNLVHFNDYYYKKRKGLWITLSVCFAVLILIFISDFFVYNDFNIVPLATLSFYTGIVLFLFFGYTRIKLRKSRNLDADFVVTVTDDYVEERTTSDSVEGYTKFSYDMIHHIAEDKKFIYIFISRNRALLLDKNGFVEGTADELKAFFKTKLEAKKTKLI